MNDITRDRILARACEMPISRRPQDQSDAVFGWLWAVTIGIFDNIQLRTMRAYFPKEIM